MEASSASTSTVVRWPDPTCLAAGSQHVAWARDCLAAAGFSDRQIAERLQRLAKEVLLP